MSKTIKKVIGVASPLAGLIPGIGLPAAIALGAGGGLLSGGGLRGALAGGLGAAAFNPNIASLGSTLGATTAAGARGLGAGLAGAGAGAASGGLTGALLGGATAGLGGYAAEGGLSGLGNSLGLTGPNSLLGEAAGGEASSGWGGTVNKGSGLLGGITRATSDIGSALSTGTGGGSSSYSPTGGSSYSGLTGALLGGVNSINANDNAEKDLLNAQQQRLALYQPYVDAKFEPGDLTQDPGYQFRLQQGEQALNRSLAAKGGLNSGAALKAAQDYGQGLADTTYNEAYNRWLQQNQQNIGVANMAGDVYDTAGNVKANAGISNSNVLNRTLSSLLNGYGAYSNTGASLNPQQGLRYDPYTGKPIYAGY